MIDVDRQRGALFGLAVGDALGAAVEFMPAGTFQPVTDYRAGGPHGLAPGEWTDDTSMALALADSIGSVGWDLNDQARRYVAWWQVGDYSVTGRCFDIGITTRLGLYRFLQCHDARQSGDTSPRASGNGSIMRLAPVPIAFGQELHADVDRFVERLIESSLPTHGSPQCRSACAYMGLIMAGLMDGLSREEVLSPAWLPVARLLAGATFDEEVAEVARGSFRQRQPPAIRGSGYVVRSLEAALWAFHAADDFRTAVLAAVNLGDDADTTGAVCGQLAGAYWGERGIPAEWRNGLAKPCILDQLLRRLILVHDEQRESSP
jgi:ADP-ribosyl-[dinitrogen reductase] hydrolase